jgi:hypothetical protein
LQRSDLTTDYAKEVCKIGQGAACCRYLTMDKDGWDCAKWTSLRFTLDDRVENNEMNAHGDNCEGVETPFKAIVDF